MLNRDIKVRSSDGGEFDCYVVTPARKEKAPAIVLASAIHGVDDDLRAIADEFASHGYIAAAPDLFWRTPTPGPLKRDDPRAAPRGQPRLERIKAGERDIADVLPMLCKEPLFNGRAAVIGFCYGGPFAVVAPKRLGYDAGISCHGTQLLDFIGEFEGLKKPVCLMWGDKDHAAPPSVLEAYRGLAGRMKNIELNIFPGVEHGYMMARAKAYDGKTYDFSMSRALAVLESLRDVEAQAQVSFVSSC
jgi:carboxymethylenebutenolidase